MTDDDFEYRHVILPKALVKYLPTDRLATEDEWRGLGIRQSPGWEHYLRHGKHTSPTALHPFLVG
jgi:cyclin-dependent kinase regulatory subunit CKS1